MLPKYVTSNGVHDYNHQSIDFYGNQYRDYPQDIPSLCTEYLGFSSASRGDQAAEEQYTNDALGQFQSLKNDKRNAGAVLWTFRDYWGFGEGEGGTPSTIPSSASLISTSFPNEPTTRSVRPFCRNRTPTIRYRARRLE